MGSSSVALAAAKDALSYKLQEKVRSVVEVMPGLCWCLIIHAGNTR